MIDTNDKKPSAPASYKGIRADFQGTIHLSFLQQVSSHVSGSIDDWKIEGMKLDPGIYWIVMTGSMWAYHDGKVMHTDQGRENSFAWDEGTRGMDHPLNDTGWYSYIEQFPVYPQCLQPFWD